MDASEEEVNGLIELKANLEETIVRLTQEIDWTKEKITHIRCEKDDYRSQKDEDFELLSELKLCLMDLEFKNLYNSQYLDLTLDNIRVLDEDIQNKVRLQDFDKSVEELRKSIENSIHYYHEDNLQMELIDRSNQTRSKRVEYTKIETDYNDLLREIERRRELKEKCRQAEIERLRLEEERVKQIELAEAEKARLEDIDVNHRFERVEQQPFLDQRREVAPIKSVEMPACNNPKNDAQPPSDPDGIGYPQGQVTYSQLLSF